MKKPKTKKNTEKLRKIILHKKNKISDLEEILLLMAARLNHINSVIKPALNKGKIVISDQPQSSESPMRIIAESTCENNLLVTEFLAIIEGERFVDKYFVSFAKTNDGFGLVMRSFAEGNDTFKCIEK